MAEHDTPTRRDAVEEADTSGDSGKWSTAAVALGALGTLAAVWAYWLILPGIILGIAAIALGIRGRKRTSTEMSSVAIALGVVAILLVPSVLIVVDDAEDWGKECALNPANPDCRILDDPCHAHRYSMMP